MPTTDYTSICTFCQSSSFYLHNLCRSAKIVHTCRRVAVAAGRVSVTSLSLDVVKRFDVMHEISRTLTRAQRESIKQCPPSRVRSTYNSSDLRYSCEVPANLKQHTDPTYRPTFTTLARCRINQRHLQQLTQPTS